MLQVGEPMSSAPSVASATSSTSSPGGLPGLLGTSAQWSTESQTSSAVGSGFGGAGMKNV
jgi:hypothetical protein